MKCPYCNSDAVLRSAYYVYHTKDSKNWGNMWVCSNFPKCDSFVGCHKGTDIPLGRLANHKLRELKKEAHRQFDVIWKSQLMSRTSAYKWLASMLDIPLAECHIGIFDVKQCQRVISICRRQNNPIISEYREKHFRQREVFTRGYNNCKSNNDYSIF